LELCKDPFHQLGTNALSLVLRQYFKQWNMCSHYAITDGRNEAYDLSIIGLCKHNVTALLK